MNIHACGIEDLATVEPLYRLMFADGRIPGEFNSANWLECWEQAIRSGYAVIFLTPGGFVSGLIYREWNTGDLYGQVLNGYVRPECRHRGTGTALLNKFEEWCRERGCARVVLGYIEGEESDKWQQVVERLGWRLIDRNFLKEIK